MGMGKKGGDTGNRNIQNITNKTPGKTEEQRALQQFLLFLQKFVELADKNMECTTELIQAIIAADENLSSMVN